MRAEPSQWVIDRQYGWAVLALTVLVLTLPSLPGGLVFDPIRRELPDPGGISFRTMWMPLIGAGFLLVALRNRLLIWMAPHLNSALLLLCAWCMLSALWSPLHAVAARQAFSIIGVVLLALAQTLTAWRPESYINTLRHVLTFMLVASLIVGIAMPAVGVHSSTQFELAGSWRGITYQKNGLGQLAAVALIVWTEALLSRRTSAWVAVGGMGLSVLLVLLSRSSTSLLLSMVSCVVLVSILRTPLRFQGRFGALMLGLSLVILVPFYAYLVVIGTLDYDAVAGPFAEMFGKDASFSGRTFIWEELFREIAHHPWLGYGFSSFWGVKGGPADQIARNLQWAVPNGHNGYIDLINEIGLIGFGLFLLFMVKHFRALSRLAAIDRPQFALHLALMLYMITANLTESGWFRPISFTHVLMVYSSLTVSRLLFEQRLRELHVNSAVRARHTAVQPPPQAHVATSP